MPRIIKPRGILGVISVIGVGVVFLASYTAMLSLKVEDSQTSYTASEIDYLREQLDGNVSQVSSLEDQIGKLNEQIAELRSTVVQEKSRNSGLREQNSKLNSVLDQIDAQMKIDEQIEHIKLTVQALQNPPKELPSNP